MPTEPLLPKAPLCWPARWGAVLAQGLESSAQARLLFSFQPQPGKAEVLETPTRRLPALQARRRSQIPAAAHQPPASTCHAPGGLVAHGSGAHRTSLRRPSPTGKPLRVCLDTALLCQAPLNHNYILFPQEHVLDIRLFHFHPAPRPHSLSCSGPWCSLFLGGARRGVSGGHPSASMLPGSGTTGLSYSWRFRQTLGRTS